jgi:hypothetical protein
VADNNHCEHFDDFKAKFCWNFKHSLVSTKVVDMNTVTRSLACFVDLLVESLDNHHYSRIDLLLGDLFSHQCSFESMFRIIEGFGSLFVLH